MVKSGSHVILIIGGKEYNALVNEIATAPDSHLGADGEPALHLTYVPDLPIDTNTKKPKVMQPGYIRETVLLHDVVHHSHKFSAEYMKQHGLRVVTEDDPNKVSAEAEIRNRRGAAEWREVTQAQTEKPAETA